MLVEDVANLAEHRVDSIAQHGLSMDDVEQTLTLLFSRESTCPSGRKYQTASAVDGLVMDVVFEGIDEVTVYPATA